MKHFFKVIVLAALLSGCEMLDFSQPSQQPPQTTPPIETKPPVFVPPEKPVEEPPIIVELPPKQYVVNWNSVVNNLLQSLVTGVPLTSGNVLLIDAVKNNTGSYVQTQRLSELIDEQLRLKSTFNVVSKSALSQAKRELGLPVDDKLATRSKVLGLARFLAADYVLSTALSGDATQPKVTMQLMTVNTGEIVWTKSEQTSQVEVNPPEVNEEIH